MTEPSNTDGPQTDEIAALKERIRELEALAAKHKRDRDALYKSELLMRAITESAQDAIIMMDAQGRISYWNPAAERIFGYTSDAVLGRNLHAILAPPRYRKLFEASFPAFQRSGSGEAIGKTLQLSALRKSGEEFPIELSLSSVQLHDGSHAVGIVRDISDREQAKKALQESEEKFRAYIEKSPLGIFVTDDNGQFVEVNPAACEMSGYTEEELLNLSLRDFFAPEFLEMGMKKIDNKQSHGHLDDEIMVQKKNGETFWIHLVAARIDKGNVIAFCQDITQRRLAEDSLHYQLRFEKMVAEISRIFVSTPSERIDEGITHALKQTGEFFQIDRCYVFQFSGDGKNMSNTYEWCAEGVDPQINHLKNVPTDSFPWWMKQIKEKTNIYIPDVNNLPPEAKAEKKELQSQGTRSLLCIPLIKDDAVFGFLGLDALKKKAWSENHVMLLTVVAELIANAYAKYLTEQEIQFLSFHDILTGLYNRTYLENEMKRLDTERQLPIGIILADLNNLKLANDALGHETGDALLKQTAEVLQNSCRREDIIARWGGDEFVVFLPQTTKKDATMICKRIQANCKKTNVNGIPLSLALGLSIKASANKNLAEVLKEADEIMYKQKLSEKEQIKDSVLKSLIKNLEAKSFETASHYTVMQTVAQNIGRKKGLSASALKRLKMLIPLHDIGNINIPEGILTKKDPLTAEEFEMIKKHPETGYRIARATEKFAPVAEDILAHHERWDGSGYPHGKKGKTIPLLARITAIADAYEVMVSGRPYKKALPRNDVIAELKKGAGTQFDPALVDIFLSILEKEL